MKTMGTVSLLKGTGYLISTLSVILLGIVSWKSASADAVLLMCLLGGMATSIAGMTLRWLSHREQQKLEKFKEARSESDHLQPAE